MMLRDKKGIRPLLVQVGVALAISFAGFLFSRLKIRATKSGQTSRSPRSSDCGSEVGARTRRRDDRHGSKRTPSSISVTPIPADSCEDAHMPKVAVDNSMIGLSPSSRHSADKDGYLLPEFNDLVKEFDLSAMTAGISPEKDVETTRSDMDPPKAFTSMEKDDYEQEIRHLRNLVRVLQERERNLDVQLLELYGLKEQEAAMRELQNRLKISNMEAKFFTLKIESLQADKQRLQAQVADNAKITAELDAARAKIKLLKRKLRFEAEQNKEEILALKRRVSRLQEQETEAALAESDIQLKLQKLKDLEAEAEELRKSNMRLQLENVEVARQLESTKVLANSVLEDPEAEELREVSNRLRQENDVLAKEVEQLQADRCSDVEELVYLRWINACLRYELRNYQPPPGKTVARDLSKSLSPKSEEKAKQLILEYANTEGMGEKEISIVDFGSDLWSTSQRSCVTDSMDFDESYPSSKPNNLNKIKIFNKLRRLVTGKDIRHESSLDKTGVVEDPDSPHGSSSISTNTDTIQSLSSLNSSRYSSRRSSRHSLDNQRVRSPRMDDVKDLESGRTHSDLGSSHPYKRFSSGRGSASDFSLDQDLYSTEKSELVKYAEVLKDSGNTTSTSERTAKLRRKAVSLGSAEAFRRMSE